MAKNINMTQGKPARLLLSFALPLMFGNVFQQLYTVVDTAVVGRGVGMNALAALGTVDWLTWMMLGIAQGYTQGFSVRISQKYGEGDREGLKKMIGQSAVLAVFIAILGTIISQVGLPIFLNLLKVPSDLRPMAALYARTIMGGFTAIMFYNFCAAALRAIGDSKTPLKAMIVAAFTNIVLDMIAVFVLNWGIAGAAAATVAAQCLSGVICAVKIYKTPELRFHREDLKLDSMLSKNLIKIGTPVAAKNIIIALGGMAVQTIVNGFGMSFIAGFTATSKLYGILEIAAISYGYAVTTYIGQNYGAKQTGRIKKGMRSAVVLALATSVVISIVMILLGRKITMLFISSEDPALVAAAGNTAYEFLVVMCIGLPVLYMLYVFLSALQGLGNTVIPMLSGIIEFVLRVTVAFIVGKIGYESGIFWAESAAWLGAAVFLFTGYRKNMKKMNTQWKEEEADYEVV